MESVVKVGLILDHVVLRFVSGVGRATENVGQFTIVGIKLFSRNFQINFGKIALCDVPNM